jgi:hypothetical protein
VPDSPPEKLLPLVVRPSAARRLLGDCSLDVLYTKIRNGELVSFLDGRRRLITTASIEADIARRAAAAAANGFRRERFPSKTVKPRRRKRASGGVS